MRKIIVLAVGLAGVAVLCGAALLLSGTRDPETSRGSPREDGPSVAVREDTVEKSSAEVARPEEKGERDPIHLDAPMYAKDFGVSLEEADRRLDMQGDTLPTELERELKKGEPDAFAGLWLRHDPDYGITVAFAGAPERAMDVATPLVEGTQWEGTVKVKRVEASLKELNAARAEAEKIFGRLGMAHDSGENVFENRIEFGVADKARFQRKLRATGLELPEHVVVREGMAMPETQLLG